MFPSPCGDKLQLVISICMSVIASFRPLAGINCNVMEQASGRIDRLFPSPCGELIGYQEAWADYRWFPSPYGV